MDNLKFTAEMAPVEIEGTTEQKKQSCLVVQTYTRNSVYYKMTIINPDLVQYPEVFITQKMAIESIIKHVNQGPAYTYDEKTDIIEIKYKMFDTHGICLQLKKDLTNIPTIEQRITRLELLLDTLTLDELIESHTYPSWSTYEEFMKLPGYKYFDAFHNAQRYFNSEPMVHLDKFRDIYYVLNSIHQPTLTMANNSTQDSTKKTALSALADYVKPVRITQQKDMEQKSKDVNFYSTMYKQPANPHGQISTDNFRDYFQQNLKTFLYSQYYYPYPVIAEYLRMYIFGFYLLNHQILFGREVRIELHQLGDKITLHIFRSKKIIVVHRGGIDTTINLTIPEIKNIKVDGVYVQHERY
jgi:hypothetical protein